MKKTIIIALVCVSIVVAVIAVVSNIQVVDDTDTGYEGTYLDNDIFNDTNSSNNVNNEMNLDERIANECEYILASGENKKGDYYELVCNRSQSFDGRDEIGVIKNNKWLIPLTTDSPFHDENGVLKYFDEWYKSISQPQSSNEAYGYSDTYLFCANNCFALSKAQYTYVELWNVENGKTFSKENINAEYIELEISCRTWNKNNPNNHERRIVTDSDKVYFSLGNHYKWGILDAETMTVIKGIEDNNFDFAGPIADGLFFAKKANSEEKGFYDLSGNLVIDLTKYNMLINAGFQPVFKDGECTFVASNSSNKSFIITVDTSGKTISSNELK